jgi:hypothetical protein
MIDTMSRGYHQQIENLEQQLTALRDLCGEMVKEIKLCLEKTGSSTSTIKELTIDELKFIKRAKNYIHRHEQLTKEIKNE